MDPAGPGLTRRRRGRGFSYHDASGAVITDHAEIARLKALVIPPAWQDVWISPDPQGHIQAVGTDAAGRRQYRYHDEWRRARDVVKYDRVLTLGAKLGDVRDEIVRRLGEPGLGRDRVLAAAVRMLDVGVFRAGGEQYAPGDDDEDGTFGLATLRREHVSLKRGAVLFSYPAKGNIPRSVALRDPLLHRVVGSLLRRKGGGEELLAYKIRRDWCDVKTADLNGAVKELAGEEYTCKDLRTWNATVLAAVALAAGGRREGRAGHRARPQAGRHRRGEAGRPSTWATPRRWPARPTSTRGCWSGSPRAARCCRRCRSWRAARRDCPRDDATRAVLEHAVVELLKG